MEEETWSYMPAENTRRRGIFDLRSLESRRVGRTVKILFIAVIIATVLLAVRFTVLFIIRIQFECKCYLCIMHEIVKNKAWFDYVLVCINLYNNSMPILI